MKKISKKTQKDLEKAQEELNDASNEHSKAINEANNAIQKLIEGLEASRELYSEKLAALKEIVEEITNEQEQYIEDKEFDSDTWRDTEKGQAYIEWNNSWKDYLADLENLDDQDIEINEIDDNTYNPDDPFLIPEWEP